MNAHAFSHPVYLVTDKRADGRVRIIAEFVDPESALQHARMLRWAGSPAEVLLAAEFRPDEAQA